ncbi:MAG TPA: zinc ribbon domain-containing protein [Terriglobales bacterium]|jgi:putative FmdB family regulatory protein|nr:zinc ribbon domain-containing protein [Terriglobales bacterium]
MPLYEYLCKKCGHRFEEIKKFSDKQPKKCPECGGVIEQVISAPAVQFKGSGWYVTDYAKKGSVPAKSSSSEDDSGAKESKESKDSKDAKESSGTKETKESKKDDKPKSDSSSKKQKKD